MTTPQQPYYPQGYPGQDPYAQPQQAPQYGQPGYPAPGAPPQEQPPQYYQPQQPAPGTSYMPPPQQVPPPPVQAGPPPSLKDWMTQPAGGGNSLSFMQIGTSYSGTILRTVTSADIEVATEMQDRTKIAKYNDGRQKLIMKVPVLLDAPTAQYPDGSVTWVVKSNDRNELLRAMEAAGAQVDPELGFYRIGAGDHISITYTHDQPSRNGMNPRKVKRVEYAVGNGVPPELPQAQLQGIATAASGYGQPPQQPAYQQAPQPDPNLAYQQATGQPVPQPVVPVTPQQPFQPQPGVAYQYQEPPQFAPAPPTQPAAGATPGLPPGAQPTAPASPSNPGGPGPDWPADVKFIPGLTPAQARTAQQFNLGLGQPQQ